MCPRRTQHHSSSDSVKRLIFSCSGASDVGHIADLAAREATVLGLGKMSCIAGLQQGPRSIRDDVENSPEILAIDGCGGDCVKKSLEDAGIKNFKHIQLVELGLEKDNSPANEENVAMVVHHMAQNLKD